MSSDLKVTNIKHESSSSNNLVLASDGNVSVTNTLSAGTIGSGVTGFGLVTHADQWRLTTDITTHGNITTNLEQVDTDSFSPIGSSLTQSSGIFQFPTTGTWLIQASASMFSTGATQYAGVYIQTDINGTNTTRTAVLSNTSSTSYYMNSVGNLIFNVTNTSTHKVSFYFERVGGSSPTSRLLGDTNLNYTHFTFIRLGDT